jgi:LAG1, DNA binding/Beta-trefoil DNA-binding domain
MSGDATAMSTAQPIQLNTFEWSTAAGDRIDGSSNERFTQNGPKSNAASSTVVTSTNEPILSGRCVSKNLYINDADEKRKRVEVMVKIQLANGFNLGTFASKGIKVISKPSKKRQNAKNMDLCIHHGSTISLFNRIRSQTVSTKYLGVSTSNNSAIRYGGNVPLDWPAPGFSEENLNLNNSTCFSVRTTSWDPFVIWIVDTSGRQQTDRDMFNSQNLGSSAPRRPTPPIIALQDKPDEPIAIHYNQPVVLQCLHTGLVSPVMIIRKVDKGSSVLGGLRTERGPQLGDDFKTGGEYGDEGLGDPVSQLHKVAFQIVNDPSTTLGHHSNFGNQPSFNNESDFLPRLTEPATYLNCASDVVGMHQVSEPRKLNPEMKAELIHRANASRAEAEQFAAANGGEWDWASINEQPFYNPEMMNPADSAIVAHEGGRVVRKRRVSCDMSSGDMPMYRPNDRPMFTGPGTPQGSTSSPSPVSVTAANNAAGSRRRVNSLNDVTLSNESHPRSLKKEGNQGRRSSVAQQAANVNDRAFWTEDVSDAAIWTIVGTGTATYVFYAMPCLSVTHRF